MPGLILDQKGTEIKHQRHWAPSRSISTIFLPNLTFLQNLTKIIFDGNIQLLWLGWVARSGNQTEKTERGVRGKALDKIDGDLRGTGLSTE